MATAIRVSELQELTNLTSDDVFLVSDVELDASNKVKFSSLQSNLLVSGLGDVGDTSSIQSGQVLQWDGTEFVPVTISTTVVDGDGNVTIDLTPLNDALNNLHSKLGVGTQETHLGVFNGNILPDDSSIKVVFSTIEQELQTISDELVEDEGEISALETQVASLATEADTRQTSLNQLINTVSTLASETDTADIAIRARLDVLEGAGYLTGVPTEYVTETELAAEGFLKIAALTGYATETYVTNAISAAGIPSSLEDLSDIALGGTPDDGDVLKWNAASSKWTAQPDIDTNVDLTGYATETYVDDAIGDLTLAGIADITGTPGEGQVVKWVGGGWVFAPDTDTDTTVDLTGYATEAWVQAQGYSTGGGGGGIQLNDLSVITNQQVGGSGALSYNNITGEFTFTQAVNTGITLTDVANDGFIKLTDISGDLDVDKVYFKNVFSNLADLPSATTYHGMFAHVHATGKAYYAHGGNWIELANDVDIPDVTGYATEAWVNAQGFSTGGGGGSQNLFNSVQPGQWDTNTSAVPTTTADVVADSTSDTLSLLGANGITVTSDEGNDTIVFSGPDLSSYLSGTTIQLEDNLNNAFEFKEGNNLYLRFNTFNTGEKVQILKDLWVAEGIHTAEYIRLDGDNKELQFYNTGGTGKYVGLKAPTGLGSDQVFTLPGTDGTNGQVLTTDGAGNLGFATVASGGGASTLDGLSDVATTGALNGQVLKYNGSSWVPGLDVTYDDSTITSLVNQLQTTLNKLVPTAPSTFDNFALVLTGQTIRRLCADFTPTDNTGDGAPAAGSSVYYNRDGTVTINSINDVGPGDSGTVHLQLNGSSINSISFDSNVNNGTDGALQVSDNKDASQSTRDSGIVADFYQVYDVRVVNQASSTGYNKMMLYHGDAETQTLYWYEDATQTLNPVLNFNNAYVVGTPAVVYSSSVPHYLENTEVKYKAFLGNVTGDVYNTNNNVLTTSGSTAGFGNAGNFQYDDITGGSLPPPRNFAQSAYEEVINDISVYTRDVHVEIAGSSAFRPHTLVTPYGNKSTTPSSADTYLIMGSTARTDVIDEDNILVNMGTGTGNAIRVSTTNGDYANGTSFAYTASNPLNAWDAAVVGGVLSNNQTNYQAYKPAGPDLSARNATQYITFKITRSQVSQFTINYTGSCAGCFVRMENNANWMASLNGYNGWGDMFKAYKGSGVPDDNANGVASGGVMTSNGGSFTCVFGTESSSNDTNNEILVRFKLTTGQSITAMSFTA